MCAQPQTQAPRARATHCSLSHDRALQAKPRHGGSHVSRYEQIYIERDGSAAYGGVARWCCRTSRGYRAASVVGRSVARLVSLPQRSLARRAVQALALSGVVARRLASGAGAAALLRSPSFVGAVALLGWSVKKLVAPEVSPTD